MRTPLLGLIRLYQFAISPLLGVACRYEPTCSRYSYEAIETHGVRRGLALTVRRLARCRPGGGSGFDPVPPRGSETPPASERWGVPGAHLAETRTASGNSGTSTRPSTVPTTKDAGVR